MKEGWVGFGTHADQQLCTYDGDLEFAQDDPETGIPAVERHADCEVPGAYTCVVCGIDLKLKTSKAAGRSIWVGTQSLYDSSHTICEGALGFHQPVRGPADGHTFRISVTSRASFGITGTGEHKDAEGFIGPVLSVDVRAWNLSEAVRRAHFHPVHLWFEGTEEDG